jgi:predicted nucleotidyltransferase component of viral defense system
MLSYKTIEPHTLELLRKLSSDTLLKNVRLVGGTALALQYGHRRSIDLDFFGNITDDAFAFKDMLRQYGTLAIFKESKNIHIYSLDNIKIDFVNYEYPWIDSPIVEDGLILASPTDIAAMKVNAIEGRGTKKDFIDLYYLLQYYTLDDILSFYKKKYPEYSIFRALMSMTYFEDADEQIMPKMFDNTNWDTMKNKIRCTVDNYSK